MASYGRDFYGLAKYGRPLVIDFYVEPFIAVPEGYGKIKVSWTSPSGTWTNLRLLKSKAGWAVNENDGEIVLDQTTSASTYTDVNLQGGTWYYYTLYLKSGTTWNLVGRASSLAVTNAGFTDLLLERVPKYFHYIPRYGDGALKEYFNSAEAYDTDRIDQNNTFLDQFFAILGWGFDYLKNFHDTVLQATNPRTAEIRHVENLALTLGTTFEPEVPAAIVRSKIENAGLLAQRRGTLQGLREVAALSTGYDIVIEPGTNMYLNEDQASFYHPQFEEWDGSVNYPTGHIVQFAGRTYIALTGAYGQAQKPPTHPTTSNTWWNLTTFGGTSFGVSDVLKPALGQGISTWNASRVGSGNGIVPLTEAIGISSPIDAASNTSNSLRLINGTGGASAFRLWGATDTAAVTYLPSPQTVVGQGIPIPRLHTWNKDTEYRVGNYVVAGSRAWKCLRDNTGRFPEQYALDWEIAGVDERLHWVSSMYAHSDFDGTAGVTVDPHIAWYDERGNLLRNSDAVVNRFFDPFNNKGATWDSRVIQHTWVPSYGWTTRSGQWSVVDVDESTRAAWALTTGTTTMELQDAIQGWVNGDLPYWKFGATFLRAPLTGREQALVFRWVDANNYAYVGRQGVKTVVAGVTSTAAGAPSGDYSASPIKDGDRVVVNTDVAGNTVRVYVNGTLKSTHVGTITQPAAGGSGGGARFRCGMMIL